ncbi:hypothetical protein J3F84DRAFT_386012 [Trichoderma pleuroticola]
MPTPTGTGPDIQSTARHCPQHSLFGIGLLPFRHPDKSRSQQAIGGDELGNFAGAKCVHGKVTSHWAVCCSPVFVPCGREMHLSSAYIRAYNLSFFFFTNRRTSLEGRGEYHFFSFSYMSGFLD